MSHQNLLDKLIVRPVRQEELSRWNSYMKQYHYLGWRGEKKYERLKYIVNNLRFLMLPWAHVKNLASKVLSLNLKRLSVCAVICGCKSYRAIGDWANSFSKEEYKSRKRK
jgi:hypothetical protein